MVDGPHFRDRIEAGKALAQSLSSFATQPGLIVLGLSRGGVPIAQQVAAELGAPFDVIVSRKIGVPGIEEVALGAIAEGSHRVVADNIAWYIGVPSRIVERLAIRERIELERRADIYRSGRSLPDLRGRTVILVDDGLATGATMRAAARSIRSHQPRRLIAAVPVASPAGAKEVRAEVDEFIAIVTPSDFETVSDSYADYSPVHDEDVMHWLGRPRHTLITDGHRIRSSILRDVSNRIADPWPRRDNFSVPRERTTEIPVPGGIITGDLGAPQDLVYPLDTYVMAGKARGLVILAHGGGSSRESYRNRYIAGRLRMSGFATLRVDLLTAHEREDDATNPTRAPLQGMALRQELARNAMRLTAVCEWAVRHGIAGSERIILSGASSGAAAAIEASVRHRRRVFALVTRGGRVDLATHVLPQVDMPMLMIVGGADPETIQRSRDALRVLGRTTRLVRVPGAGHTFEEPGALGAVAEHTATWLERLVRAAQQTAADNQARTSPVLYAHVKRVDDSFDSNGRTHWR